MDSPSGGRLVPDGSLTSDRWQRIHELFAAALPMSPGERARFLDHECRGDDDLRRKVDAMFLPGATTRIAVAAMATPTVAPSGAAIPEVLDGWLGLVVGQYRLLDRVGQGGMGTVYKAVRDDDQFKKTVAIKMLRLGAQDPTGQQRFRGERQILASLEHPHICRLLDGGAWMPPGAAESQPFIVMEYVEGLPITTYCERRGLGITARLELVRKVCDAVSYAHRQLVIHRDVKPDNILVTPDGTLKLLDFGMAKLLDAPGDVSLTLPGMRVMTPAYASPEQVRGEAISTVTDVYALGAVLYELLTERRPHPITRNDPSEIYREICERDVRPPSTWGNRQLRGDLDVIVLKALQKEPSRRYQSVEQLSEDIRRYLARLPLVARADTIAYRTTKFVRRHWLGIAATVTLMLTLAGGVAVSLYQARIAETRFQQVRKLANRFLFDFHDQIRNLPGSTAARQMVVATALEYLDSLSKDARTDPDLQWELAKAYERVGDVQGDPSGPSLGQTKAAHESYKKSAAMQQELVDRGFAGTARRESLSQAYAHVMATARLVGTPQEALRAAERSVEQARLVSAEAVANASVSLMMVQLDMGEPLKSIATGQAIVSTLLPLSRHDASWTKVRQTLARTYLMIGRASHRTARFEQAADGYQQAIHLREQRLAEPVLDTANARDLVLAYHGAGDVLGAPDRFSLNRPQDAEVFYRKALDLAERLAATDSKNATARIELTRSIGKWAAVIEESRPAEGLMQYRRALDIAESVLPDGPDRQALRGYAYMSIGAAAARLGRRAEARENIEQSRAIWDARLADRPDSPGALSDVADIYLQSAEFNRGDPRASIPLYRTSLAAADRAATFVPKDFGVAFRQVSALEGLAAALEKTGPPGEVTALRQRLAQLWTKWDGLQPGSPFIQNKLRDANSALAR
jgi:serine/threonine protein kinase/tetratricopeptide (TPR) repeat protein